MEKNRKKEFAPIALFVFKRVSKLMNTINSLLANIEAKDSPLIIFSDGPRSVDETTSVDEVRKYIRTIAGFKTVKIVESQVNKGLGNSIVSGVSKVLKEHDRVIVLEDDLVLSRFFLEFLNSALDIYHDDPKVVSIHGYTYPADNLPETYFLKGADCWGWATWKRGWDCFDRDGKKLLFELRRRGLVEEFDFGGSYRFSEMLAKQAEGEIDSWAIRWYASAFLADKITLYPGRTLVFNDGCGPGATNFPEYEQEFRRFGKKSPLETRICLEKLDISESKEARENLVTFFQGTSTTTSGPGQKVLPGVKRIVKKIVKDLVPPILPKMFAAISQFNARASKEEIYFHGNFQSWEKALKESKGYDSKEIFEKVKTTCLRLKEGEGLFERDSVLFSKEEFEFQLLSSLALAAKDETLNVLDFGGSFGSKYFQHKKILEVFFRVFWNVVEQSHFVTFGKENFEDQVLQFFYTIEECKEKRNPNVFLISSVLHYLEEPIVLLNKLNSSSFEFLIFDLTPFLSQESRITLQEVPKSIYEASYPAWFFRDGILEETLPNYRAVFDWRNGHSWPLEDGIRGFYKGYFFQRIR